MNQYNQHFVDYFLTTSKPGLLRFNRFSPSTATFHKIQRLLGQILKKYSLLIHLNPGSHSQTLKLFCSILELFILTTSVHRQKKQPDITNSPNKRRSTASPLNKNANNNFDSSVELLDIFWMIEKLQSAGAPPSRFWVKARSLYLHFMGQNTYNHNLLEQLIVRKAMIIPASETRVSFSNQEIFSQSLAQLKQFFESQLLDQQSHSSLNPRVRAALLTADAQTLKPKIQENDHWTIKECKHNQFYKLKTQQPTTKTQFDLQSIRAAAFSNPHDPDIERYGQLRSDQRGKQLLIQIVASKLLHNNENKLWQTLVELVDPTTPASALCCDVIETYIYYFLPIQVQRFVLGVDTQNAVLNQLLNREKQIQYLIAGKYQQLSQAIQYVKAGV